MILIRNRVLIVFSASKRLWELPSLSAQAPCEAAVTPRAHVALNSPVEPSVFCFCFLPFRLFLLIWFYVDSCNVLTAVLK